MTKDYKAITRDISAYMGELRKLTPEAMQGFSALAKGAGAEGVLDKKTKELIALAIGVTQRCDGCIGFHAKAAIKAGATREEILETLSMAIYMGAGPSMIYASEALRAFDELSPPQEAQA